MAQNPPRLINEEEKLRLRLEMSHAERFRAFMRLIRLSNKLKNAIIIKA